MDTRHYCTKSLWFARDPDDFPAPFNKAFHFEMGIEAAAGSGSGGRDDDAGSPPTDLPKMLVDYVRIAQVGRSEPAQRNGVRMIGLRPSRLRLAEITARTQQTPEGTTTPTRFIYVYNRVWRDNKCSRAAVSHYYRRRATSVSFVAAIGTVGAAG